MKQKTNYRNKMEENIIYVFQNTITNEVITGYSNEGEFIFWETNPSNWEELKGFKYHIQDFRILKLVQQGDLKQLN